MDISRLSFTTSTIRRTATEHAILGSLEGNKGHSVGIDPGVNYGLTIIRDELVEVRWGKLPQTKVKGMYGIEALNLIWDTFDVFNEWKGQPAIVEGAAYHSQFGQVGLEEVRFGFFVALYLSKFNVRIVPPATIRKAVFGDGKQQAMDIWPKINHNGADSLAIALMALGGLR